MSFSEFELLTLREGLFKLKNCKIGDTESNIINETEFNKLDNKIIKLVGALKWEQKTKKEQ